MMTTTTPSSLPAVDLIAALTRMKHAQRTRGAPSWEQRIDSLDRLERALLGSKKAIAAAVSRDFGNRSLRETLAAEVFVVQGAIEHAKANLRDWMAPEPRDVRWVFLPSRAEVVRQPLGVVGIISPWNYPVLLALAPLVGALAAGNRAMIKPSELAPETAALLRDVLASAFAEDEVRVATGGAEVGEQFAHLPFDHLLFTGSTRVGKLVMRAAAENLVPVTLELGGKSPAIVGTDASTRVAADRIMAGKLFNAGQTCIAPDYVMVPESERDRFVDACRVAASKLYPTLQDNLDYTAIITAQHHARLGRIVADAEARGARVVRLGSPTEELGSTRKMAPVIVVDPTEEMLVLGEEIFGPILPVLTYRRLDEAIAYVNDHPRPLALYYFGRSRADIDRILTETISGAVTVNETLLHIAQDDLPFGGVGPSGMGSYHGREGFQTFTKNKPVFRQAPVGVAGLFRPPYGKVADGLLRLFIGK